MTSVQGGHAITLAVDETVLHPGWYRVALSINSRSELPADPMVTVSGGNSTNAAYMTTPVFPVLADHLFNHTSGTTPIHYTMSLTLPNVTCTKCTLQVIEFMNMHGSNPGGGYFYHHCADLKITADPALPPFELPDGGAPPDASGAGGGAAGGRGGQGGAGRGGQGGSAATGTAGRGGTTGAAGASGAAGTTGGAAGTTGSAGTVGTTGAAGTHRQRRHCRNDGRVPERTARPERRARRDDGRGRNERRRGNDRRGRDERHDRVGRNERHDGFGRRLQPLDERRAWREPHAGRARVRRARSAATPTSLDLLQVVSLPTK